MNHEMSAATFGNACSGAFDASRRYEFSPAFQRRDQVSPCPRRVATIESGSSFRRRYATRTPR